MPAGEGVSTVDVFLRADDLGGSRDETWG